MFPDQCFIFAQYAYNGVERRGTVNERIAKNWIRLFKKVETKRKTNVNIYICVYGEVIFIHILAKHTRRQ